MKILNTIIITDTDSEISMVGFDDPSEFSGNIVFTRDALPASLVDQLYAAVGKSPTPNHTAVPDLSRGPMKAEFLG
jgi:hypothetical protein